MKVKVRAKKADGYDTVKAYTNVGYGYVFAWANIIDTEVEAEEGDIENLYLYLCKKVESLYDWLKDKDEDIQDGAIDALTTLEQSDWDFASQVLTVEISIIGDLNIPIEKDFV